MGKPVSAILRTITHVTVIQPLTAMDNIVRPVTKELMFTIKMVRSYLEGVSCVTVLLMELSMEKQLYAIR